MAEIDGLYFGSDGAVKRTSEMWLALGTKLAADAISFGGDPAEAVRWATCAEACFWKATGEADTHDVKDVVAPRPSVGIVA